METGDHAIRDSNLLRRFDGITDPEESRISDHIDFAGAHGISGGVLTMVFDEVVGLQVESRFATGVTLSDDVVVQLIDETLSQWSDGVGSGDDVISGVPFRACPDRDLVLSVWDEGSTYRVFSSWNSTVREFLWELQRDGAGRPSRVVRFPG
jgi:hypothetical protein